MDKLQEGHVSRTRALLEESALPDETKETMHDLLTTASRTANGIPDELRHRASADTMLALSNLIIRQYINTPKIISEAIAQHQQTCSLSKPKPVLSWDGKGILPAGQVSGKLAVAVVTIIVALSMGWSINEYVDHATKTTEAVASRLAQKTSETATTLATKTAGTVSKQDAELSAMETRITRDILTKLKEEKN